MGLEDRLDTMGDSMGLNEDLMMINGSLYNGDHSYIIYLDYIQL